MASTIEPLAESDIRLLAGRYRFRLDVKSATGTIGLREGRETGASVEIQDFRDYVPGDDPRRIDWLAYGRTDRLIVRLFREEVSPFVDVIVDCSASMALQDGRKAALAIEIPWYLHLAGRSEGILVRLFAAGEQLQRIEGPEQLRFEASASILFSSPVRAAAGLRRSAVRVLLTDFMDPAEPAGVIRVLSAGCARLIVMHLLGPWEADPRPEGPALLDSPETRRQLDITLDPKTVAAYRRRLAALRVNVEEETFKCGGLHVGLVGDRDLETVLREEFLPRGLVEVY